MRVIGDADVFRFDCVCCVVFDSSAMLFLVSLFTKDNPTPQLGTRSVQVAKNSLKTHVHQLKLGSLQLQHVLTAEH